MERAKARAGGLLTIDLAAIRHNYNLLRTRLAKASCAAVVKADAYGLGAAHVAPALVAEGCRHFFVANIDEGIALRSILKGIRDIEIYVLHGAPPGAEEDLSESALTPVLNSSVQIEAWQKLAQKLDRRLPAILQIDTGMSRMGLEASELENLLADEHRLRGIDLHYLMSHLAIAEEGDHWMNREQLRRFRQAQAVLGVHGSLANSSGIFLGQDYHFDLVRPGAALYGLNPLKDADNPMRPVVRLQGKIVQLRTVAPGDYIGYGLSYQAETSRRIATVLVGYADGWMRFLSNRGYVLFQGHRVPIVGRISMDTITVDVTAIDSLHGVNAGDTVDLIANDHPVDEVAKLAGTIGYEILTGLGSRFHRVHTGELQA